MAEVFEALEELTIPVGTADIFSVDVGPKLDLGVLATGTPTVAEDTTTDLTITSQSINTSTLVINHNDVIAGKAVQFFASGFVAGTRYKLIITITTDTVPAGTRKGVIYINAKAL